MTAPLATLVLSVERLNVKCWVLTPALPLESPNRSELEPEPTVGPTAVGVPVDRIDPAIGAGDEQVEVVGRARHRCYRRPLLRDAVTDPEPRTPPTARVVPVDRIDPAIGAGDKQVEVVGRARHRCDRRSYLRDALPDPEPPTPPTARVVPIDRIDP